MSKHTPGPFIVDANSTISGEPPFRVYSKTTSGNVGLFFDEKSAHLFAAAPDLLAALKRMEEADRKQAAGETYDFSNAVLEARAAIAKAEGQS